MRISDWSSDVCSSDLELAEECRREGGHAWLMDVQPRSVDEAATYRQLFDRSDDYAELCKSWKEAGRTLSGLAGSEVSRMPRRLQRARDLVRAIEIGRAACGGRGGQEVKIEGVA